MEGMPSGNDWRVPRPQLDKLANSPDARVAVLAAEQDGMVSLAQLIACGLSHDAVTTRVRTGRLYRLHRGVYAVGHPAVSIRGRQRAAVLACGASAVLSHFSAAVFWGLVESSDRLPQVSVADAAGRGVAGVRVHRRPALPAADVWTRSAMRVTSPAHTLLDVAADLTEHELRRTVRRAQVEGHVNVRQLVDVLARGAGVRGAPALRAAIAGGPAPTRSELEDIVLDLIDRATPERPQMNAKIRLEGRTTIEADFLWRARRLVIEADGAAWHDDPLTRELDAERQAALEAAGYRVLRITWTQALRQPLQTIARIRAALAATAA